MGLGTAEILIIILGAILLFGGRGLPEFAKSLGRGLREFQNATRDIKKEAKNISNSLEEISKEVNDTVNQSIEDEKKSGNS
tara:strand:- start:528 stop:770 length:243 start_codon:yes stop_codon:yes gene_type:complete